MARTFEFVLHFVGCVTVTVSPNQIIIIIIIINIFGSKFPCMDYGAGWVQQYFPDQQTSARRSKYCWKEKKSHRQYSVENQNIHEQESALGLIHRSIYYMCTSETESFLPICISYSDIVSWPSIFIIYSFIFF